MGLKGLDGDEKGLSGNKNRLYQEGDVRDKSAGLLMFIYKRYILSSFNELSLTRVKNQNINGLGAFD